MTHGLVNKWLTLVNCTATGEQTRITGEHHSSEHQKFMISLGTQESTITSPMLTAAFHIKQYKQPGKKKRSRSNDHEEHHRVKMKYTHPC